MLIENQKIKIKWSRKNKKRYESLGYVFTNYGDDFFIDIKDLTKGSEIYVKVICDYCGKEYDVAWYHYYDIKNKGQKDACYDCRHLKMYERNLSERQENLYTKALYACEKRGYILLTSKEDIKNNTTYIKYVCPLHGVHEMRISNLINGKGCPDCATDNARKAYQLSQDEISKRVKDCGGVLLNGEEYVNQYEKNLLIKCPECGTPFLTSLVLFTQHGGQVCDYCMNTESVGEKRIRIYLENHDIEFKQEYWFEDCRDVNPLPFDFYIPEYNMMIEFDGRQHYGETNYFSYSFEKTKEHDLIKNNYCNNHDIRIIRIPYWDVNNINKILDRELNVYYQSKECA